MAFPFVHHVAQDIEETLFRQLELLGTWNSTCLFRDGENGFLVFNWWTRTLLQVPNNLAAMMLTFLARRGARMVADPENETEQMIYVCHPLWQGLRVFGHRIMNHEQQNQTSMFIDELHDNEYNHPLFMEIPAGGFAQPVHLFQEPKIAMGSFLNELPPIGNNRRYLFACSEGYVVALDQLEQLQERRLMMVALGRFSQNGGNEYRFVSRVSENMLPNDMVRMQGHYLQMIGDDLVNVSVVLIPEAGPTRYVMFRYDVLGGEWERELCRPIQEGVLNQLYVVLGLECNTKWRM